MPDFHRGRRIGKTGYDQYTVHCMWLFKWPPSTILFWKSATLQLVHPFTPCIKAKAIVLFGTGSVLNLSFIYCLLSPFLGLWFLANILGQESAAFSWPKWTLESHCCCGQEVSAPFAALTSCLSSLSLHISNPSAVQEVQMQHSSRLHSREESYRDGWQSAALCYRYFCQIGHPLAGFSLGQEDANSCPRLYFGKYLMFSVPSSFHVCA